MKTLSPLVVLVLAAFAVPSIGSGQESEPAPSVETSVEADASADEAEADEEPPSGPPDIARRTMPEYRGRAAPPPSAEEVGVAVPRALLSPLYFVFEYVLRRPLGWLLTTAERERWDVIQLLPFAQVTPTWGVIPTVLLDFGFVPSAGAMLWLNDIIVPHNQLVAQVGFGGVDWLRASLTDRQRLDDLTTVELSVEAWARPDYQFYGLGAHADRNLAARFGRRFIDADAALRVRPWRASHLEVSVGISANELYDTAYLGPGQRTLSDATAAGWFPGSNGPPGGWPSYTSYWQRLEGSVDTRQREPEGGGGVRVEGHVEHAFDIFQPAQRRWLLWGGGAGAYVEIDRGRTIGLHATADLASRLGEADVPFTELPDLATELRMPGFRPGFLRGESAAAAVLDYRYPIGPSLAGFVSVSMGNAFGPMFEDFAPGLLRMGFGLGIRTVGEPDQAFTITAGMGTDTIDRGMGIATFRLLFGTQRGL